MRILALDTSSTTAAVAILDDDKLISESIVNNKKTHSQTLMPMVDTVLAQAELDITDMDLIACANGPGSFTGLRIGVSAAKGLSHATNIKMVGVSTLKSLAYNLPDCSNVVCPIMDARRQQVYNAVYEWVDGKLLELRAPRALSIDELIEDMLSIGKKVEFLGDGVIVHKDYIKEKMGEHSCFAPISANEQRASSLAQAAKAEFLENGAVSCYELATIYLRKPQAERELEERENMK